MLSLCGQSFRLANFNKIINKFLLDFKDLIAIYYFIKNYKIIIKLCLLFCYIAYI